jgi:two-component system, sensor histidine kinase and response regulator
MPEMDGYAATREIKKTCATLPIIAMTGQALAGDKAKCLSSGMNDYIPKPIDIPSLATILEKWLKHSG